MSWITTKLLAYALGGMTLIAVTLGGVAWWNAQQAEVAQLKADRATQALDMAQSANRASTAQIIALSAERDAFVLKRAMEQKEANEIVAESREQLKEALAYAFAAKERIRQLSRQADCRTAMAMPICPAIADELRAAP